MKSAKFESTGLTGGDSLPVLQSLPILLLIKKDNEILTGLSTQLEKKLEDLQQIVSNPSSILSYLVGLMAAKGENSGGAAGGTSSEW
ncbi:hypothetical protein QVD17_16730 [Tagetes erecta]|uniref:Uncharacterized protein n=1 Tax=Tagetes erecta TaxID=13708 RepID=A0AAD8KRX6_TARER|nr:hypothetical protein QVD17_16730 [Tagetes erecta]